MLSVYVGIRPLVKAGGGDHGKTSSLSRDHTVHIDASGPTDHCRWVNGRLTGIWPKDTVNHAITLGKLEEKDCVTRDLHVHGYDADYEKLGPMSVYGADAAKIRALAQTSPDLAEQLHPDLPYTVAEVVWAAREEMARSVEDVLARRTRALFLNAHAAIAMAPRVSMLLAKELGRDEAWPTHSSRASSDWPRNTLCRRQQRMLQRSLLFDAVTTVFNDA